jgi:BirA family biotin operon repressor/biotin-[acetyl-CoA-carboxylase] ligase
MVLEVLDTVTSTMDVARENVLAGRVTFDRRGPQPCVGVLAGVQTQGRGQRGREWFAPPGECLLATYYYPFVFREARDGAAMALVAGVAVAEVVESIISAAGRVGMKWPNDILIGEKKVAGILIEMVKASGGRWVGLVGVGVNVLVSAFPAELAARATSLALEGVCDVEVLALAERIGESLRHWAEIYRSVGLSTIVARWRSYDTTPGRRYEARTENGIVQGVAIGVEESGALRLALDDGRILTVSSASSAQEI